MTTALSNVLTIVGNVMTTIEGNSVLMAMFCAPLVGVAVSIVKKLVRK